MKHLLEDDPPHRQSCSASCPPHHEVPECVPANTSHRTTSREKAKEETCAINGWEAVPWRQAF